MIAESMQLNTEARSNHSNRSNRLREFQTFQRFQSFNGSTVREASRQASSTAVSSEPCRGITMTGSIFRSFLR